MMLSKFTLLLMLFCPLALFANKGEIEHKITVQKEFKVGSQSKVSISNKYGKILLKIWDKQECRADIEIIGNGRNADLAKKAAESVEIVVGGQNTNPTLVTNFKNSAGARWFNAGHKDSRDYVTVNYVVYVPANMRFLNMENSFGDIIARSLPFDTRVSSNYGFVDIGEADKKLMLVINYTDKCRIEKANTLEVTANYSMLKCEKAGDVEMRSNNGTHSFGKIGEIRLRSNYDDLKFESTRSFQFTGNYTDVKMNEVKGSATVNVNYSSVDMKSITVFEHINIDMNYSDVKLGLDDKPFRIKAVLKNGDINTRAREWKNVNTVRDNSNLSFSAITTNATDASPLIDVKGAYSSVKLG